MPEHGTRQPSSRIPSFVQHRNRLTEGQQRAWDEWWTVYGGDVTDAVRAQAFDAAAAFGRPAPLILEIGSGSGETTAAMAAAEPGVNLLAVEVYEPGLARLLLLMRENGSENLRMLRGDAVELLEHAITPASLAGVRVYFPDPWPKRRHHKRRLVQPEFAALVASRLADGATLHLATDWEEYALQMRDVCDAEPLLRRAPGTGEDGWYPRPAFRPLTKFEQRAEAEGRPVHDLLYTRGSP
ncbi:MAG: tRNA (guanosine(46)-N7)-methyltransferase TrmB [Pseudonocardia sp.]|nr:tRNA (guanosine(46)-N7)-methyltransferase TrmB [Pseudonocardia sp.]